MGQGCSKREMRSILCDWKGAVQKAVVFNSVFSPRDEWTGQGKLGGPFLSAHRADPPDCREKVLIPSGTRSAQPGDEGPEGKKAA